MNATGELEETFLGVRLNGELVADSIIFLQQRDSELLANVADLRNWRIRISGQKVVAFQGQDYIVLKNISGLRYTLNAATLTVSIEVPVRGFDQTILFQRPDNLTPQGGHMGAYLNYDIRFSIGDISKVRLDSFWELMLFKPETLGIFRNTLNVQDINGDPKVVRLESTWSKDLIDRHETLTFGDTYTRPSALGRLVQFGGFKWASNFTVDPRLIRYPTGSITGFNEQEGTGQLYVNDTLRSSFELPRGPFDIHQLPNFTGDSDVKLVITDPTGYEQIITRDFYINTESLAQGLSEYSYQAGFLRESFGKDSFAYGNAFISGTHRYGFTDNFTGGGHLEFAKDSQVGGISGIFTYSGFGRISSKAIVSHTRKGVGYDVGINYDYTTSRFNIGFGSVFRSDNFSQLNNFQSRPPPQRIDSVRFGINLDRYGSLGFNYFNRENRVIADSSSVSAYYRVNLGISSFIVNLFHNIEPESDLTVTATLIIPLSLDYVGMAGISSYDGTLTGSLELQKNRGISELGTSFRLRADTDGDQYRLNGGLVTQTRYNQFLLGGQVNSGNKAIRAAVAGSVSVLNNEIFFSRPINRSFAVVDTGGIKDISIYSENRFIGKTDAQGQLLIPDLNAYIVNNLRLDSSDVPFDATVLEDKIKIALYFRSGALARFPVTRAINATASVVDENSKPLPAGSILTTKSGQGSGLVAAKGRAYLNNLSSGEIEFSANTGMGQCSFIISIDNDMGLLPDLGELVCH